MIIRTVMMNKLSSFILVFQVLYCNCQTTTLTPMDPEVVEGNDVTFVCTVSSAVPFVSWNFYDLTPGVVAKTVAMRLQNGTCALSPPEAYLSDTTKYSYNCSNTVYQVTVKNVQRSQHNYRWSCLVPNQSHVPISTLKVLNKTKVTSFTIDEQAIGLITVNENDRVLFECVADGNPTPTVRLINNHGDLKTDITHTLNHAIDKAKCLDTDNYTCSARNIHNVEASEKSLPLYVKCRPRSADAVRENKTSAIGASLTFTFNAIAYPKPTFTWNKWNMGENKWSILRDGGNVVIKSSDLQSNLTISKVTEEYFTRYELKITNDVGTITQHYTLSQYDKPETPVGFRHVEDLTTATSIYFEWKPGFNGGPPQTFHIKYKKSTTNTWNYINISDTGEDIMRYTLTGLTPKTQYHIIIYASNIKGQSEESIVRTVHTKEEPASLGPLIGGIVGGIALLVIFIIVGIIIWRRYPICKERKENKTSTRRQAAVSRSPESGSDDDEMIENQLYEKSDPMYALPNKSKDQNGAKDADHKPNDKEIGGYIYAEVDKKKIQPKEKRQKQIDGDLYAEVDKKKKKQSNEKRQKGKVNKNVEDTYENSNIVTNEGQKSKIVNQDGLEYIDLVFNKSPGEKIIKTISGDESVPYDAVDFTKKAEPLP